MRRHLYKGIKKNFKLLSIVIVIAIILGFNYNYKTIKEASAASQSKPSFTINNVTFNPEKPKVGEDITVTGTITPKDFTMDVPENDIVLVLDVSGSMNEVYCYNCKEYGQSSYWSWKHDYLHKVSSDSKLKQLKEAANNFIDKMKEVPNLKIGIVAYSSKAWVNPNGYDGNIRTRSLDIYDTKGEPLYHKVPDYNIGNKSLLDINDHNLSKMINSLTGLGGTNTGEGIRKGIALLDSGGNNAKKTLVLMSDGLPTFYSVKGSSYDEYTNIDFTDPNYRGNGSDDNNGINLQYAKTIGNKVKEKSYKAFTIGYGLNYDGNNKMKQIHNSMTGINLSNSTDENYNEENGFFATSDGAIDGVFNTIADKILKEYTIDNGVFTDTMIDGFDLAIGSHTVSIPNMEYKSDGIAKEGKLTYTCEPYNFSFIIRASKSGSFENIFNNSKISFPWNGETIECQMPKIGIVIQDNRLPDIEASLASEKNINIMPNEECQIRYEIDAKSFQYNDSMNQSLDKNVVILFDTSKGMDLNKLQQFKNGGFNKLLSDSLLQAQRTKYCIITYDSVATVKNPRSYQNFKGNENDTTNLIQDTNSINEEVIKKLSTSESSERNVGLALEKASDVLNEDKTNAEKYILLVSSGDVNYNSKQIDTFKEKNSMFKVLSLAIGSNNGDKPEQFLYNFHKELAGEKSAESSKQGGNYFVSPGTENNNDINDSIMLAIAERIRSTGDRMNYTFHVEMNFDLGNDISLVSGLKNVEGTKYKTEFDVTYEYNSTTNEFISQPINDVAFNIKANKISKLSKFGDVNTIKYQGITELIEKNIETPKIKALTTDMHHGVYNGIDDDRNIKIDESTHSYAKGSTITMGGKVKFYEDTVLKLEVDAKVQLVQPISVYKVVDGELVLIKQIDVSNDKKTYDISISSSEADASRDILIIYTCKIMDDADGELTNSISNDYERKDAILKIGDELPELF
ncbi:VWA domain-containing protein [Clostridium sp. LQ25]|uniref:vWA domain-containing protein n=1 Tax=Clostridium sp. LQ25 TaxID=2992805 RepID=UPI002251EA99|nr:VWA domain-containing protein [Clostridium sp. LQ25]UZT07227.1 VWA domain-containing protein [Clostridium sp. LQ25]